MKRISVFLLSMFVAVQLWAQNSTLTVKLNGNRNTGVTVDGQTYSIPNNQAKTITISNLTAGQHSFQVLRKNTNNNRLPETRTITLREGYNTNITVNGNGEFSLVESRIKGWRRNNQYNNDVAHDAYGNVIYDANGNPVYNNNSNSNYGYGVYGSNGNYNKPSMTDATFTSLYNSIRGKWFPNSKYNALVSAFNNTSNYFTTAQAKQLIELVSSEENRLTLAKLSYRTIVDPMNFGQLYDVLSSQASRDALDTYARSYRY